MTGALCGARRSPATLAHKIAEIESKREAIARSLTDHEAFAHTTTLEIAALQDEVADQDEIIDAAGRALKPAPILTPHVQ